MLHRAWFIVTFLAGLVFMMAVPPFQIGGERQSWVRLYSCDRVPDRVLQLIDACAEKSGKYHFVQLDAAMAATSPAPTRVPEELRGACDSAPTAYILPSLATRVTEFLWPYDKGATLMAFYSARLANWLLLSFGVWLLLMSIPLPSWALFVYSLPLLMLRGASINQDAGVIFLACCAIAAWQRKRRVIFGVVLLIFAYTVVKLLPAAPVSSLVPPDYLLVTLAALCALASDAFGKGAALLRRPERPLWQNVAGALALLLMILVWKGALAALRDVHYDKIHW